MIRLEQEIALGIIGDKSAEEQDDNDDNLLDLQTPMDKQQDDLIGESVATVAFPSVPDVLVTEDDEDQDAIPIDIDRTYGVTPLKDITFTRSDQL